MTCKALAGVQACAEAGAAPAHVVNERCELNEIVAGLLRLVLRVVVLAMPCSATAMNPASTLASTVAMERCCTGFLGMACFLLKIKDPS